MLAMEVLKTVSARRQKIAVFPPTVGWPMCPGWREIIFTLFSRGDPSRAVDVLWLVDCQVAFHSKHNISLGTPSCHSPTPASPHCPMLTYSMGDERPILKSLLH